MITANVGSEVHPPLGAPSLERPLEPDEGWRDRLVRFERAAFLLTLSVVAALAALKVLVKFDVGTLWDDSYMFQRYAQNVVGDGRIAWNPGGEAAYGLTSPLFLIIAVPF